MYSENTATIFFSTEGISVDNIPFISTNDNTEFLIDPKFKGPDEDQSLKKNGIICVPSEIDISDSRELTPSETRALLLSKAVNMAIKSKLSQKKIIFWMLDQLKNKYMELKIRYFRSDETTLSYLLSKYLESTKDNLSLVETKDFIKGYIPTISQLSLYSGISLVLKCYGECVIALLIESMSFPLCFLAHLSTLTIEGISDTVRTVKWLLEDSKISRDPSWDDESFGIKLTEIICSLGSLENSIKLINGSIKNFFTKSQNNTKSFKGVENSIDYIEYMPILEPVKIIISSLSYLNNSLLIFLEELTLKKTESLLTKVKFSDFKLYDDILIEGLDIKFIIESVSPINQEQLDFIKTRIRFIRKDLAANENLLNISNMENISDLVLNFKKLIESNLELLTIINLISLQKLAEKNFLQYIASIEKAQLKKKNNIVLCSHESKNIHKFRLFMTNCLIESKKNDFKNDNMYYSLCKYFGDGSICKFYPYLKFISSPQNQLQRRPKIPKGTQDISPQKMSIRNLAFDRIREIYRNHGAVEIDTPVFELKDTLLNKYGEDSKLIYELKDQGGEQLSLRYDLTVPLARYIATMGFDRLKRFQIGKVYRRDEPQMSRGRFREFYQCDLDIVGHYDLMVADAEIINIATEVLCSFSQWIGEFKIKINHRLLLDGILEISGVPNEKFKTICSSIDKLDKETWEKVRHEMINVKGITEISADKIGSIINLSGDPLEIIRKIKENEELIGNESIFNAITELEILFKYTDSSQCTKYLCFDLSLARGLDYYTGVIYEAVIVSNEFNVGSIAAGGRYDKLIGMFSQKDIPAVGFSVGIERIMSIIEAQIDKISNYSFNGSFTDFLICNIGDSFMEYRFKIASLLWNNNITCEISQIGNGKLKKQFDFASNNKIPYCIIVGENELENNKVQIKLIRNDEVNETHSQEVHIDNLIEYIKCILKKNASSYSKFSSAFK